MRTRKLGTIEVSAIGMGCMGFSHGYGAIPSEEYSIDAIRAAHEAGCTFFDTAEIYGPNLQQPGHNELLVGKAVRGFRQDVVLATKLYLPIDELAGSSLYDALKAHLAGSLERLQTDYADLYYLHRVDLRVPIEDVAEAMGRLIDEGLIRGWGISQVGADLLARAHAVTPVSAVQNLYNMVERDAEDEVIPFCLEHGIGVVPFSPIASGLLSGKVTAQTEFEKVDDVRNVIPQLSRENIAGNMPIADFLTSLAARKGATSAQIALAWMLAKYPNVVPIPGSKNRSRVLENLGAADVVISSDELAELERALDTCEVHGHRGCVEYIEG